MIIVTLPSKTDIPRNGVLTDRDRFYIINLCYVYHQSIVASLYNVNIERIKAILNEDIEQQIKNHRISTVYTTPE